MVKAMLWKRLGILKARNYGFQASIRFQKLRLGLFVKESKLISMGIMRD